MGPDILLGRDLITDEPVRLSLKSRMNGLYVLGKQGRGKTNLLLSLIIQDLYSNHGLCVLDPHGDLTVDILGNIPPHREHDVYLLDLQDTQHPFAFDLFADVDPADEESLATGEERVVGIFKKVWGDSSWGPRLEDLLGNAVHVLLRNPGMTLADFPRLLTKAEYRQQLLQAVTHPDVLDYFEHEYTPLTPKAQANIYGTIMNKVRKFLRHPLLGRIVSQSGATVDFREIMAKRNILLVRLSTKYEEATSLLGTSIVLRLFETTLDRQNVAAANRPPFALYADEFQLFATPTFGHFLQQARKYNVATTLAHQVRSQLSGELQDAVKGAVNVVTFQVLTDDAREMAHEYDSNRAVSLPGNLLVWALKHSDPTIQNAATELLQSLPYVTVRYDEETPALPIDALTHFFERRLRQAVREGNARATPFPAQYWYGTYDLETGGYARIADAFAILRDRLLLSKRIDAGILSDLPIGYAAAKLEQRNGAMRQAVLHFPLAVTADRSTIVKMLFDHDGRLPDSWPQSLNPAYIEAGLRARRIRQHNRARYQRLAPQREIPRPESRSAPPTPPLLSMEKDMFSRAPVLFEVDLD